MSRLAYLAVRLVGGLPRGREGGDGEAVRVFPVPDLGLFHQAVQFLLGQVLHLLPVGGRLQEATADDEERHLEHILPD